ncbi:MAG: NADH-quinone oxidoreductase subunit A [Limnochordales bacterium]|jgi:NADH:ubiquinone oxidoreductase subunit 3 (chain A)|nr:NADH:ubiquinone oxidoreductase subunit A [Bacillota bacterium]
MLSAYTDVAIFFLVGAGFVLVTLAIGRLLRPHNPYPEKLTPYECGEVPIGEGQVPFNIRYYIFALLFVVFDVEVVFLFPWAVVLRELGTYAFVLMVIFLVMLVDGLVYAWKKGVLRWV